MILRKLILNLTKIFYKKLKKITCLNSANRKIKRKLIFCKFYFISGNGAKLVRNYLHKVSNLNPKYILMRN